MKSFLTFLLSASLLAGTARPQETEAALAELENRYAADRTAALRLVLSRYADELEALEKKLVEAGDHAGASRVRLEIDRILPALGLPAVAEENADEFALFEEAPAPVPILPPATETDLDAILKALLPPAPATGSNTTSGPAAPATDDARPARRVLRMGNAQLTGSYDPAEGHLYWTFGRSASWTLNNIPSGTYQLQLRYTCDEKEGGGTLSVKFGETELKAEVPSTGSWKRKRDLVIGPFEITGPRADLIVKTALPKAGAPYLLDLTALAVVPVPPP